MLAGVSTWSVRHPIGVVALTLAVMVLGAFSLSRLSIDLLPQIIYPEVLVRVNDPGVPARVMEDAVTRELEEQLAITEGAIAIQSRTSEGRSAIDLSFRYGEDIDLAMRDASARLDRAKRFLPATDEPPIIFKRDPFQLPVAEYVIGSSLRDPLELRAYVDYGLSRELINLPGVAAAEVGGGLEREVLVVADQHRLAGLGLDVLDLEQRLRQANQDVSAGRLRMSQGEISGRAQGRFADVPAIAELPLLDPATSGSTLREQGRNPVSLLRVGEVAQVLDGAAEERLRIRLDGEPGIKLSIQKQPQANTVAVVDRVQQELARLAETGQIPPDVRIQRVDDQARYIRHSLDNALSAALGGGLLAMAVVYLFLGSLRRTLIIGSAIPIAILATFILMAGAGLSFNIMTLGGLALGIGMLVDSTIVMLENIYRHQRRGESVTRAADLASREVTGAIVASTSTNLAAVLPFLFIGGLVGLLFRELIFTISAAILVSMVVALTLVPALAGRVPATHEGPLRRLVDRTLTRLQDGYAWLLAGLLRLRWVVIGVFVAGLALTVPWLADAPQEFLPKMDEGNVQIALTADEGLSLDEMDAQVAEIESIVAAQPEVAAIFTTVGGFVFGRSTFENPNRASIQVVLRPLEERSGISSNAWGERVKRLIAEREIPGLKVSTQTRGIRGIRFNNAETDVSLRIKGEDLETLARLGDQVSERLKQVPGLDNVAHGYESVTQEISIRLDRERTAAFGVSVEDVGALLRYGMEGRVVTELIDGDRAVDIRLRLDRLDIAAPGDLESIVIFSRTGPRRPLRLGDLAQVELLPQPASIQRDRQQRIVEITASAGASLSVEEAVRAALEAAREVPLPMGYSLYEAGSLETLKQGRDMGAVLLALALFMVLVAMAVQYESIRNPLIILLSVPFALVGVVLGLQWTGLPVSMPVWLGLIMLAGIVVNNAIVLVEFVEIERRRGLGIHDAILSAARLRLRPILMTTLTTVVGLVPLAMAVGEGSEMLQPLAVTIVSGLSFSTLVSLLLVPMVYRALGRHDAPASDGDASEPRSPLRPATPSIG
ncbi:MAG: efflux RND transporter permease subunit [Bdellovibrio bacteriovorus]